MSRKKKKKFKNREKEDLVGGYLKESRLHPETKHSVWALIFLGIAVLFILAGFQNAGPFGNFLYRFFDKVFGWGYYLLPLIFLILTGVFFTSERQRIYQITF